MENSILLENVSRSEFKNLISESIREEIAKFQKPSKETNEVEKPISQTEAILFLGKSRQTLIAWRKKGVINAYTLGGRVYFLKSELLKALKDAV